MLFFRFDLRVLLAAVAVVGIAAALWCAEPSWRVGLVESVFLIWTLASLVILSIGSTQKAKAFWIGAAAHCIAATFLYFELAYRVITNYPAPPISFPHALFLWFCGELAGNFRPLLLVWAFAPVVGLLCIFTHWLFIRPPEPKE